MTQDVCKSHSISSTFWSLLSKTAISLSLSYQQSGLIINLSNQRRPKRTGDHRAAVLCWDLPQDWPFVLKEEFLFCYLCFVALLSESDASNPNSNPDLPREPVSVLLSFLCIHLFVVALASSSCSEQGATLCYGAQTSDCNGFSCCAAPALDTQSSAVAACRPSSCSLVAPRHVESSWTNDRTHVHCIGRQILIHCTTKEDPSIFSEPTFPIFKMREFPELSSISLLLTHFVHIGLYLLIPYL